MGERPYDRAISGRASTGATFTYVMPRATPGCRPAAMAFSTVACWTTYCLPSRRYRISEIWEA